MPIVFKLMIASAAYPRTCPMAPQAKTSIKLKPAGSFVVCKKVASSLSLSPASAYFTPFCSGSPCLLALSRWKSKNTNRPNASETAVAPLMMRFVSLSARVTCRGDLALVLSTLDLIWIRGVKADRCWRTGLDIMLAEQTIGNAGVSRCQDR